jgi:hypothetical protein
MNRRNLISGMTALGVLAAPGLALAAGETVKLSKFFAYLDLYLALPPSQRNRFALAYYAYRNMHPAPDLKAVVIQPNGARSPVQMDRSGRIIQLPSLAELHGPDMVEIDANPGDKVGLRLETEARIAPSQTVDAHELVLALDQAQAAISKQAGLLSFTLPKLTCAYFSDAGSGHAILANGRAVPLPVATGRFFAGTPYFDSMATPDARTVSLAKAPSRILLGGQPR